MKLRRIRSTIRGPLILFIIGMVLVVALLVLWNVFLAVDYQRIKELAIKAEEEGPQFHWAFITLGSIFFFMIIVLFSILGAQLFVEIRFTQRLANFVATFTHELNSPLASIKLFAQTLRRSELSSKERERFLDLILADVERLHGQISNVLRAAQVDSAHGIRLVPEVVDLRSYLEEYVAFRQAAAERLEAKVTIELTDGPTAEASIDRQVFRQALDNLVDNAIKYGQPGGVSIGLRIVERGERVCVEVEDDGSGIPPEKLDKVFERFIRADEEHSGPKRPGTGLGLWIVSAIVDAHDGQVRAHSLGVNQGTTMRIILPRASDREAIPQEALA